MDGLMGQIKHSRVQKITVDMSELPNSIPAGYTCGTREVETKVLKFHDLVLIKESNRHRARRVIRLQGDGVILGGDGFNDIAPHYYQGTVKRVEKMWSGDYETNVCKKPELGIYFNWLRSFISN